MPGAVELIITEKDNAARRIAAILSDDDADVERVGDVNVYRWGRTRCIGLSGHVVGVDFPSEYEDWRNVEPAELVSAPVEKRPTQESIVSALKQLAGEADSVVVATDYDREGELIGKEAYELVRDVRPDVPVDRVRFSSITDGEVTEAFENPDVLDMDLAAAGETRQVIDLVWGAALTRFLSLSAGQLGDDFISVGRVQGPTLRLLVEREREIEAFDPEDYWELFADLAGDDGAFEAQYFYHDNEGREAERVEQESRAERVHERLAAASTARVTEVDRRTRTDSPPAPFNTTAYISAAGSLGYSAQRAMSIAEDLYTAGYITYPRTDNTVYPDDLDPDDLLAALADQPAFADDAASLRDGDGDLEPTAGDTESTDHPPIHPTDEAPARSDLSEDEWELYELVVRRFMATVAEPAEWERLRVVAAVESESDEPIRLKATGRRLLDPGYLAVYPYSDATERAVPAVEEGDDLAVTEVRLEAKQTQPPRRYGQSRLIETMEEMGIGTKSTRHNAVEKLYDRGYVEGDPPRPTRLARAVVEAAEEFAEPVVSEEMTAQLEADMAAIARGERTLEEVTADSREMLREIFSRLTDAREEVGEQLRESLKADKTLGPCPECGAALLVRRSRDGSHFVGCDGYPDCEYTLPLPSTGRPIVLEDACDDHDLHEIKMLAGRKTFVHGCPRCAAERADEAEDRVLASCPECASAGGELAVKRLRTGSRLVGCTRYPDCEYSLPLPRRGEVEVVDEMCDEHDLPALRIVYDGDRDPWDLGCPICNYREYRAEREGSELETIEGIGEATAEKLFEAGIEDVASLKSEEPDALADKLDGIGPETVRGWQAKAD